MVNDSALRDFIQSQVEDAKNNVTKFVDRERRTLRLLATDHQPSIMGGARATALDGNQLQELLECYFTATLRKLLYRYSLASIVFSHPRHKGGLRFVLKTAFVAFGGALITVFTGGAAAVPIGAMAVGGASAAGSFATEEIAVATADRVLSVGNKRFLNEQTRIFDQFGGLDVNRALAAIRELSFQLTYNRAGSILAIAGGRDVANDDSMVMANLISNLTLKQRVDFRAQLDVGVVLQELISGQLTLVDPGDADRCRIVQRAIDHLANLSDYHGFRFVERNVYTLQSVNGAEPHMADVASRHCVMS